MGKYMIESPLTLAYTFRAAARMLTGVDGWKQDMLRVTDEVRGFTPIGESVMLIWRYGVGVAAGAFRTDAVAVRETAEMMERAAQTADDVNVEAARFLHAIALVQQDGPARSHGLTILSQARQMAVEHRSIVGFIAMIDAELGREELRTGDIDKAIERLALGVRGCDVAGSDPHARAGRGVSRRSVVSPGRGRRHLSCAGRHRTTRCGADEERWCLYELPLWRTRALVARAQGDDANYRRYRDRYRARAHELGFEGHIDTADAMV